MYEELWSRFNDEVAGSIEDPDLHLSYTDRQRLKRDEHADVAREKLPTLERRVWWTKVNAVVAVVFLALGAVYTGYVELGAGGNWTVNHFSFPLFFFFCAGIAALGGMWRALKLEKQKMLCELVIAHSEEAVRKEAVT